MVYCHWKGMVTVLDTQCVLTEEVTASCAMFPGCADGGGGMTMFHTKVLPLLFSIKIPIGAVED